MAEITTDIIKRVREETGAGVMKVKKVLEEVEGDVEKAKKILMEKAAAKMEERSERETSQGTLSTYKHHNGKLVSIVELLCETDFVAKNELFVGLANDLAMQVASMNPADGNELKEQDYVKDPSKKISELVKEVAAKTGENIRIGRIIRVELGQE